jgi:flavin-dependent thymidylate synthase
MIESASDVGRWNEGLMRVVLAGYNVDSQVLSEAREAGVATERLTPEVLSAAYARISRDPRPVGELRRAALEEVEKARASNRKIIFGMGHHSVAEHAVFNFDVIGISRLAIEELESFRLCSFTEKSQRYITLDHDFVVPQEFRRTPLEAELYDLTAGQAKAYERFYTALLERLRDKYPERAKKRAGRRLLEGWAKEDARYVTLLVTTGQLGLSANARNLEHIVRRLLAAPRAECRGLARALHDAAFEVAPSLLLFTEPSRFDAETSSELAELAADALGGVDPDDGPAPVLRVVECNAEADATVAAAVLHRVSRRSFAACRRAVERMSREQLASLFEAAMRRMEFFDSPLREFEHVSMAFELVVSASCYAQLKRHRMSTQTIQGYDPALGITVPPALTEVGLAGELEEFAARCEELYTRALDQAPPAAAYALTNAHRRRVLMTANLRELYHLIRLREDHHAQWDIRALATEIRRATEERMPLGSLLLCGKDGYVERYEKVFGRKPAIDPAALDP